MENKALNYTALAIGIIGAINWGLIGLFNFNLVSWPFVAGPWFCRVIIGLVGVCGLYLTTFFGRGRG